MTDKTQESVRIIGPLYQPYVWDELKQAVVDNLHEAYEDIDRAMDRAREVLQRTNEVPRVRVLTFYPKG